MRVVQIFGPIIMLTAACGDRRDRASLKVATSLARSELPDATAAAAPAIAQLGLAPASSFWATQKLIRTAELRIQVRDVLTALKITDSIARNQQTLLADSRTSQDADGKRTAEVILRAPSQQFAGLLQALRGLGSLQGESIGTQDVTKDYADLETRLAVKEQTVTRLRALLENRTAKLSEVLEVERELGRAVAELEQMKGERRYYDQQIALSTVKLTLFERVPSQVSQVTKPIADALQGSMQALGSSIGTIIYLFVALVPWLLVTLGVVRLVKPLRRRFLPRRSGTVPPAA
jgi:hypothetical protein